MKIKAHDPDLVGDIRAIRAEIDRLEGKLRAAGAELLGKESVPTSAASKRAVAANKTRHLATRQSRGSGKLTEGTAAFWAAAAIRRAGKPLHAADLVKAIEEQGHKVKQTTLVGSLYRWVKRKAVFYLAKANTFGLIEMRKG